MCGLHATDDVGDPYLARLSLVFAAEAATSTSVTRGAFPVYLDILEAGVEHNIANLWDAPHTPVVRECTFTGPSILRFEVKAEAGAVVYRIEVFLLKEVGETWKALSVS